MTFLSFATAFLLYLIFDYMLRYFIGLLYTAKQEPPTKQSEAQIIEPYSQPVTVKVFQELYPSLCSPLSTQNKLTQRLLRL